MSEEINSESELQEHTKKILDLLCPPATYTGLRRLFLLLTQSHFAYADNHGPLFQDVLGCRVYNFEEPSKGSVSIALEHTDAANVDANPSIRIGIAGGSFSKGGLGGDYSGKSDDNSVRFQTKIAQTQLRFRFKDTSADLALTMAESTMGFIESLKLPLMTELGLHSLDVVSLTDIEPRKPKPDNIDAVTMLVNIQFDFSVALATESHRLKKMAIKLRPGP